MDHETKGLGSVFFVFVGYVLSVTAFILGGNVGNQLNFKGGLLALLVGNMVLAAYAGILGVIGKRCNCSSTDMFKPVFGVKGQVVTSAVVSLFSLIFVGVYSSLVGSMASSLFHIQSPYIGMAVYLVIIILINLKGFKGMSIFSKIGVPIIGLFVVYGLITIGQQIGFKNVSAAVPVNPTPFFTVVSVVAASWMTGATFSSDVTRFVKKTSNVWFVTIVAFLCVALLESVGLLCSLGTGESDIVKILGDLHMEVIAFCIYILLTITSGQTVVFIAAQALANITKVVRGTEKHDDGKFSVKFFVIPCCAFGGLLGIIMLANGFTSTFLSALGIIGSAIPPVGGALVGHFLVVEREYTKTFEKMPMYRWQAFVAWGFGVVVSKLITAGIGPLNGFLAALILYSVLRKLTDKKPDVRTDDSKV